jgi:predicted SprT family Zn-dependent metalloprotease
MELAKAQSLCLELMNKHGLTKTAGWTFSWSNSLHSAGVCIYKINRFGFIKDRYPSGGLIKLSKVITAAHSEDAVRDTILHEIAHGLTKGHNHDYVWQTKAIEIGCNGQRCYNVGEDLKNSLQKITKYIGSCPCCENTWHKNRLPKRDLWCKCTGRRFIQAEKIVFTNNVVNPTTVKPIVKPFLKQTPIVKVKPVVDIYKTMLEKFQKDFLPLINNDLVLFEKIVAKAKNPKSSWRTMNREYRKSCNEYMKKTNKMTNKQFQDMFFYESIMLGRTTHGKNAPWIGGKPS